MRESVKRAAVPHLAGWEAFVGDIIQDGLLIRDGQTYAFSHLSFQEYLCARDIADPSADARSAPIESYLRGDDWWREVVLFYLALSKRPERLEDLVRRVAAELLKDGSIHLVHAQLRRRLVVLTKTIEECFPGYHCGQREDPPR